jgi:hypothetical protein
MGKIKGGKGVKAYNLRPSHIDDLGGCGCGASHRYDMPGMDDAPANDTYEPMPDIGGRHDANSERRPPPAARDFGPVHRYDQPGSEKDDLGLYPEERAIYDAVAAVFAQYHTIALASLEHDFDFPYEQMEADLRQALASVWSSGVEEHLWLIFSQVEGLDQVPVSELPTDVQARFEVDNLVSEAMSNAQQNAETGERISAIVEAMMETTDAAMQEAEELYDAGDDPARALDRAFGHARARIVAIQNATQAFSGTLKVGATLLNVLFDIIEILTGGRLELVAAIRWTCTHDEKLCNICRPLCGLIAGPPGGLLVEPGPRNFKNLGVGVLFGTVGTHWGCRCGGLLAITTEDRLEDQLDEMRKALNESAWAAAELEKKKAMRGHKTSKQRHTRRRKGLFDPRAGGRRRRRRRRR